MSRTSAAAPPVALIDVVRGYCARGWCVIPIPYKEKRPLLHDWSRVRLDESALVEFFKDPRQNIGVLLGTPSGGLVDIDLDVPEAIALADAFLPDTPSRFGRSSKRASHRLYLTSAPLKTRKFQDVEKIGSSETAMLVELRSTGAQTVFPASVHPSGEPIEWDSNGEPARVDGAQLLESVKYLAIAAFLGRHWPDQGTRHDAALAAAGLLLSAGLDEEIVCRIVVGAARVAKDEELRDRERAVRSTADSFRAHEVITGAPALKRLLRGDTGQVVDRLTVWLRDEPGIWPEPQDIPKGLVLVPPLDRCLLPPVLADWVCDIAERTQCPVDFVAIGAITAVATVVGRKVGIRPKRQDDWTVVPNLWGMIVGPPGVQKTPALVEAMRPLRRLVHEAEVTYQKELGKYQATVTELEVRRDVLKARLRTAVKRDIDTESIKSELLAMSADEPPRERRYLTHDTTIEKLGELLNENPNGLLVYRDELSGFLVSMDRQGHEGDRSFYNEAWNGAGPFDYDRIGRGTLHIKAACVSVLGSIQPGPLGAYLQEAFAGAGADGFIQRFQLAVYPDVPTVWRNVDRWPDSEAKTRVFDTFKALDELDVLALGAAQDKYDDIPFLRFAGEAQDVFDEWRTDLEARVRSDEEHPVILSHLGKYRSLMPSLALLLHLVDAVGRDGAEGAAVVSLHAARCAAAWCDYLEAHARRIYQSVTARAETSASILAARIRAGKLPDLFTPREVTKKGWAGLTTTAEVAAALDLLEELHWVRREEIRPTIGGGRPSVRFHVNPYVKSTP
jgi:hypothetical protein